MYECFSTASPFCPRIDQLDNELPALLLPSKCRTGFVNLYGDVTHVFSLPTSLYHHCSWLRHWQMSRLPMSGATGRPMLDSRKFLEQRTLRHSKAMLFWSEMGFQNVELGQLGRLGQLGLADHVSMSVFPHGV